MKCVIAIIIVILLLGILAVCCSGNETISLEIQNMDIVRLSYFAFNEGDWTAFADLHSPGYIQHSPDSDGPVVWNEYLSTCRIVHERFPALQLRVLDIFAANNKVAVRSVWEYRSESYIFKSHYPYGVARGSAIGIYRIKDSKIVEEWCESDPASIKRLVSIVRIIDHVK